MTESNPENRDFYPRLHLGWALENEGPVYLRAKGLMAHIAVIAQSGSGKSFMLGRMLEEIAAKTRARFLILDPNSDFVKFSVVDVDAWKCPKGKFMDNDTLELFRKRWRLVGFNVLTERASESLQDVAHHTPVSLSWPALSYDMKRASLGIWPPTHPEEHQAFETLQASIEHHKGEIKNDPKALRTLELAARGMWHAELYDRPLS